MDIGFAETEREAAANGWHGVAHTRLASGLEYEISDDVQVAYFLLVGKSGVASGAFTARLWV
jgi:hypothetical protein